MKRNTYCQEINSFRTVLDINGNLSSHYRLDRARYKRLVRRQVRRKTKEKLFLALTNPNIYDTMDSIKRKHSNYYGKANKEGR